MTGPDKTTPDKTTPDKTTPDKTTPDKTTPDKTTPDKTTPDKTTETRLRQMFSDAAVRIHPTRPVPEMGGSPSPVSRRARLGVTIGLSVCVVVAAAIALDVHAWGGSGGIEPAGVTTISGRLLVVKANGAVELVSPNSGAVIRRLVGSSPVTSNGLHLRRPTGITAAGGVAYVSYLAPTPVIVSIPLAGGTPRLVDYGMAPAASPDGTRLAYYEVGAGASSGVIAVRDLATGKTRSVYAASGTIPETLSWSTDDTRLVMSGLFVPATSLIEDAGLNVQVLDLDRPLAPGNPRFVGIERTLGSGGPTWTDGQFLGSGGKLAILSSRAKTACRTAATRILSVDPASGLATTIVDLPFPISHAVFDGKGHLVALMRTLAPPSCRSAPTTTITTTTTTTIARMPIGGVTLSGGFSGSVAVVQTPSELDRWSDGHASRLVDGVAAVTLVTGDS